MNFPIYQALDLYAQFEGRRFVRPEDDLLKKLDRELGGLLQRAGVVVQRHPFVGNSIDFNPQGATDIPVESFLHAIEAELAKWDHVIVALDGKTLTVAKLSALESLRPATSSPTRLEWLARNERPLALLYTYSLIIALVCGTAGLPHILVRFYTNPDGVAAKRTTMWVMILIGVFYVFPPVFGVMGRNLMPSLYAGTGAKGTDKVVLELPRILNRAEGPAAFDAAGRQGGKGEEGTRGAASSSPLPPSPSSDVAQPTPSGGLPWGSILSGITCAGAFAAFMSTFSGLLVSMTGALAHDVYGRMLRPQSTPDQRMRMFKWCAVLVGAVAMLLGSFVEPLQINFMVGQAFAIAAASYFPLLFMSVWWRGMTMPGAAAGMLAGGVSALAAVTVTNFSDLGWLPLTEFWAAHPLLRILCEQPAIWTVPLAIGLMIVVSRLTRRRVPADSRMKMLVLHAPEQLGLKKEYIREHEGH
jgi:Na+(H+)/acetate symporter ActP